MPVKNDMNFNLKKKITEKEIGESVFSSTYPKPTYPIPKEDVTVEF